MFDLLPYVDRCALIRSETLAERRANACVMCHVSCELIFIATAMAFTSLRMVLFEAGLVRWSIPPSFIEVRNQFFNRLRSMLYYLLTLHLLLR
jgi:hypothetical protein